MMFVVKLCSLFITASSVCHVYGRVSSPDACNDEIAELRHQVQQILDKQKLYDIKLSNQERIIEKQAIEISALKDIILQRVSNVGSVRNRGENIRKEKNELLTWNNEVKGDRNHSITISRKEIYENERKPISQSYENSKIRRSVNRGMSDNFFDMMTREQRGYVGAIAFSVYLSHDVDHVVNQVVKFDQIITNEGNGYSIHTGAFICPRGGLYLFSFFIGERDVNGIWLHLKVNSINVIDAAVDTIHEYQDLQGGNTVILRLQTGDVVFIDCRGHVEGSASLRLSSFSGVLLSE